MAAYEPLRPCTTWAMDYAASNGHLEVIKWLYTKRTDRARTGRWIVRLVTAILRS